MKIEAVGCAYRYPQYRKGHEYAIQDIHLVILPSQIVGIVGANGAGKSTLAYLLAGLLKPTRGTVLVDGANLSPSKASKATLAAWRSSVALVSQFPEDQFFTDSLYQELSFGLRKQGWDEEMIRPRVMSTLQEVGLKMGEREALLHRSPFELGGGEKRLIGIAAALVVRPEILVLDEPTAGLDARSSQLVWEAIQRVRQRLGLSIILISHELESLVQLVDHLVVMHEGLIAHQGSPQEIFSKMEDLFHLGLELPQITLLGYELEKRGILIGQRPLFKVQEAADLIRKWLKD